jgi:hypothetical protein
MLSGEPRYDQDEFAADDIVICVAQPLQRRVGKGAGLRYLVGGEHYQRPSCRPGLSADPATSSRRSVPACSRCSSPSRCWPATHRDNRGGMRSAR